MSVSRGGTVARGHKLRDFARRLRFCVGRVAVLIVELAGAAHAASRAVTAAGQNVFSGAFCFYHVADDERDERKKN